MAGVDLAASFKSAARALRGSRVNASLLRGAASDIEADGQMARLLQAVRERGQRDGRVVLPADLPGRFAAAMHAFALSGRTPLTAYYPSTGGSGNLHEIWPVALEIITERTAEVVTRLTRPARRSDPVRAAMLLGALAYLGRESDMPVRVFDVGAGPGFALAAQSFTQDFFGERLGPADGTVHLGHPWAVAPEIDHDDVPQIVSATGCDLAAFDPTNKAHVAELLSWASPDVPEEVGRLLAACEALPRLGVEVEHMASSVWLPRGIAWPRTDAATVVWHSDVVLEMSAPERAELATGILGAAGRATEAAPLHVISFEPAGAEYLLYSDPVGTTLRDQPELVDPHRFELRLNSWPQRRSVLLARAEPSGQNARWVGSENE